MNKALIAVAFALGLASGTPAWAERQLTEDEKTRLLSALATQGCAAGTMKFDDGRYEADDARCSDGKTYDLEFGADFQLQSKKLEH